MRNQWARVLLHGIHFGDKKRRLNALYRITDPWGMETEPQRFRFHETNRLIEEHLGPVGSVLEVGCGEGHQSRELLHICEKLVGIDVSARAIRRAQCRCPEATFEVGDIFTASLLEGQRFNLVLGCEILYYIKDIPTALERFCELGRACLVTYPRAPAKVLDHHVLSIASVESATVRYEDHSWTVAWWQNDN